MDTAYCGVCFYGFGIVSQLKYRWPGVRKKLVTLFHPPHHTSRMTGLVEEKASITLPGITVHEKSNSRLKYAIGVVALIFVVIGWVGTNLLTNVISFVISC